MPRESKKARRERTAKIIEILEKTYPDAHCELDYDGPLQLLVATILSAQCTDKRVNMVTPELFEKYRSAEDFGAADPETLGEEIRSTGFYRNKAKSIVGACRAIASEHGGEVPDDMESLLALPGVARKTANVVLGNAFDRQEGIVVDTHVIRLARRLKLTFRKNNQGDKMEADLCELVPREKWTLFGHLLIFHGRRCCTARKPDCPGCSIRELCPSADKV